MLFSASTIVWYKSRPTTTSDDSRRTTTDCGSRQPLLDLSPHIQIRCVRCAIGDNEAFGVISEQKFWLEFWRFLVETGRKYGKLWRNPWIKRTVAVLLEHQRLGMAVRMTPLFFKSW